MRLSTVILPVQDPYPRKTPTSVSPRQTFCGQYKPFTPARAPSWIPWDITKQRHEQKKSVSVRHRRPKSYGRRQARSLLLDWHVHGLLRRLVALSDGTSGSPRLDFFLLLDESAACAPVCGAAVARSTALDAEPLTDLGSLDHGIAVVGGRPGSAGGTIAIEQ